MTWAVIQEKQSNIETKLGRDLRFAKLATLVNQI